GGAQPSSLSHMPSTVRHTPAPSAPDSQKRPAPQEAPIPSPAGSHVVPSTTRLQMPVLIAPSTFGDVSDAGVGGSAAAPGDSKQVVADPAGLPDAWRALKCWRI